MLFSDVSAVMERFELEELLADFDESLRDETDMGDF